MSNSSVFNSSSSSLGAVSLRGYSSISANASQRATAQLSFSSDPKYKKYTQQVEKCLNSFENIHEWADCIAFLKQLLKTLQSYIQFREVPRKYIVAKRLAQCLNPALPTGVHQRALDVFSHIFSVLGPEGLQNDLSVWSSGLFPFFEYSATSVKPTVLNLFDSYYLALQSGLRPVMRSLIIALLPGLEEETSEFFDQVLNILDRLSGTVSPSFFFQNIWLIMLTTPSARGTSLNYLARRLPHLTADSDISDVVGKDMGLMIRAFAGALEDENILVRRGVLDIMLQSIRLDGPLIRKTQIEDRIILMRAATSVVLRRDLSLNRRLYTWLLGSDEKVDRQIVYFKECGLELLRSTLRSEMCSPSGEYSESRPFKIFLSLLDKWEIGAPLSQVLVNDTFTAVKFFSEKSKAGNDDLIVTANTLYEALEPQIVWKRLLVSLLADVQNHETRFEGIQMVLFVLKAFSQDEEIREIHLPIIFAALIEVVDTQNGLGKISLPVMKEILLMLGEILRHIPHPSLMHRPNVNEQLQSTRITDSPSTFAFTFYDITTDMHTESSSSTSSIPVASALENLASLTLTCALNLSRRSEDAALRDVFSIGLLLMNRLVDRIQTLIKVSWDVAEWLHELLTVVTIESVNFLVVDRIISLVIALHQTRNLDPHLSIDKRITMRKMVTRLLGYLRHDFAAYHIRAVDLLWSLEKATSNPHVESIIAQTMTITEYRDIREACEAFGVFWRLSEDNYLPGFRFKVPLMIVLDTLKSADPTLHRIGESWMRCSLKSYLRILDLFLFELLDSSIRHSSKTIIIQGKDLQFYVYERKFDQSYVNHLLDLLLTIIRFGGQGFMNTSGTSPIGGSHAKLLDRVGNSGLAVPEDASYLDVLVGIILRFIQSEPSNAQIVVMGQLNIRTQSTAIDILQAIIVRGYVDGIMENIEAIVVGKLLFSVHFHILNLQNKFLHLLHSVFSASTADTLGRRNQGVYHDGSAPSSITGHDSEQGSRYTVHPLFLPTLIDGISVQKNRPNLQHWLDFMLLAIPQFQPALQVVIIPLNECICRQLYLSLESILTAAGAHDSSGDVTSTTTDAEMIMLLNGLERMIMMSLANASELISVEEENTISEKSATETTGLFGYVSTVFASESNQQISEELMTNRSSAYKSFEDGVSVIFSIWSRLGWVTTSQLSSKHDSFSLNYNQTRERCRNVLEILFRSRPAEVLESIVYCWHRSLSDTKCSNVVFELIDLLIANAQTAVHMICESISGRFSATSDRVRRQIINANLNEVILFNFLEEYLLRLDVSHTPRIWGRFLQLVKDVVIIRDFKTHHYHVLSSLTILGVRMAQINTMEDRRIRKDFQEYFGKLLDASIAFVGRSSDQGSWIRRGTKDSATINDRDSYALRDDKAEGSFSSDTVKVPAATELVAQINEFIAIHAITNLRVFFSENDKILSTCNNIVYYILNPSLKGKARPMDVDQSVLAIMSEMTKIPCAIKAWKSPVTELLNDNRLFSCNAEFAMQWRPLVKRLFDADKLLFSELLTKVTTTSSANIFTNREYEMLLRSLSVRRLSFVLFSADRNYFLSHFPAIQEKMVDIFRNVPSPVVQSEVFLMIRVLLCRLSPHNMTSFWPVLLTELYRIFEQTITSLPADGSEDLPLILAASKCLDLLLVLQTPEFQVHQWMFVTDTVDAIYRPDNLYPEAMTDQLADIVGGLSVMGGKNLQESSLDATFPDQQAGRKPLLNTIQQIESIRDLSPFFSNVSILSYESIYASGRNVDWEAVDSGILKDIFDGR